MQDQQGCQAAIECLDTLGYEVLPEAPGYIIRHRSDRDDVSHARDCADLIELAELLMWAAQRSEAASAGTATRC